MFEIMFNEITTHEKSFNNWVIIYFYHFCFTIIETTKLVLKSFIRFYTQHIYIFQLKAHVGH